MLSFVVRLVSELFRLIFYPLLLLRRARGIPQGAWISVEIEGDVVDIVERRRFFALSSWRARRPLSLHRLGELATAISGDPRVRGMAVAIQSLHCGMATATSLRAILQKIHDAGRKVVVHLPLGCDTKELYVASAADEIYVGPQATVAPIGFATSVRYVKSALAKAGLEPQIVARGQYKSAGEQLVRDSMSDQQREQLESIHDVFYAQLLLAIGNRRGIDKERAKAIVDGAPYRAAEAVAAGLVDGAAYEDEMRRKLDGGGKARVVPWARYMRLRAATELKPLRARPLIGVIPVHGTISSEGPISFGGATDEKLLAQIRVARSDARFRGVILHIDSPGGSALASDRVHHELEQLAKEKPLVACLANVAASGGYYVAAPCHAIVAQPTTITGSIGVLSARVVLEPLMSRLGIVTEVIKRGARAEMLDPTRALTADEQAAVEREIEGIYGAFVDVVARGRRLLPEEVEKVAQGRVWTGAEAASKKLVDSLGGFDEALAVTRALLGYDRARRWSPVVVRAPRRTPPPLDPPHLAAAAGALSALGRALGIDMRVLGLASRRERVLLWSPIASMFDSAS